MCTSCLIAPPRVRRAPVYLARCLRARQKSRNDPRRPGRQPGSPSLSWFSVPPSRLAYAARRRWPGKLAENHWLRPAMWPTAQQMTGEHLSPRRGTWCGIQLNTKRGHGIPSTAVCSRRTPVRSRQDPPVRPTPGPWTRSSDGSRRALTGGCTPRPALLYVGPLLIDVQGGYVPRDTRFARD